MNFLTIIILFFAVLGALDRICGNRFGLGKEFEKGFHLLGTLALSMIGMIVIAPLIAKWLTPVSDFFGNVLHIDPSVLPASFFANDMGAAPLAIEMAQNEALGRFNGLVVASMMGCTISFTIPFALGTVEKKQHKELLLGLLCGIVTIPFGCFVSGLLLHIPLGTLLTDLIPLILFAAIVAVGLILMPDVCVKIFKAFGVLITAAITIGLVFGMINLLAGKEVIRGVAPIEEGGYICLNSAIVLSGMLPFIFVLSKLLAKPLRVVGNKMGIDEASVLGMFSSLVMSATTFENMKKMEKKGVMLNGAFAVSGAFALGDHLAFTMAFDGAYILPVVVGKLISGFLGVLFAYILFSRRDKKETIKG